MNKLELIAVIALCTILAAVSGVMYGTVLTKDAQIDILQTEISQLREQIQAQTEEISTQETAIHALQSENSSQTVLIVELRERENTCMQYLEFAAGILQERIEVKDLRVKSNVSNEWIDMFFAGTPLEGYGRAFTIAERMYGINAVTLAKMAAHESGYGSSRIAQEKNNLFGYMAYDGSPFESAKSFENIETCVYHVADYISKEYIDRGGKHYNGTTLKDVGLKWASDRRWAEKIERIGGELE